MEHGVGLFWPVHLVVQGRYTLDEAGAYVKHHPLIRHLGVMLSHNHLNESIATAAVGAQLGMGQASSRTNRDCLEEVAQ